MFDLITGSMERPLREHAPGSKVVSIVLHVVVLTLLLGVPLLTVTHTALPQVPDMLAFISEAPAPPPPPPPPPMAGSAKPARQAPTPPTQSATAAPIESPAAVVPEPATTEPSSASAAGGVTAGVTGGIEGGVVGGVVGGAVGGLVASAPPPPPLPPAPKGPIRVGGQIKTPDLLHRVEPIYPELAAAAHITGTVILEASVGPDGCVQSVKVIRSQHALLDRAAMDALKQWQYSPLVLNGTPMPFVLTVTFSFSDRAH